MSDRREIDFMLDVMLIQVAIADYRDHFVKLLSERCPSLRVQVGSEYFESTTTTSLLVRSAPFTALVPNLFFFGRKLCWQRLEWRSAIAAPVVVGELNPRLLSTWVLLVIRRALSRRTVLWGHAWARKGPDSPTELLRHAMRRLASGLLFYTEGQDLEFRATYPRYPSPTFVAPNALYDAKAMGVATGSSAPTDFVYVGRLVEAKKVGLLLDAFRLFSAIHPESTLHIVGSGDRQMQLASAVSDLGKKIKFHGHISDVEQLRSIYALSVASVSPGYVGLSVTQSLSFGVPMIIARDEPHSPEIECLVEDFNGTFFESDSPKDLCAEMDRWYAKRTDRYVVGEQIVSQCRSKYSVDHMVNGFLRAVS